MGIPGSITVHITTVFDNTNQSASRTVKYIDGYGLNCLASFSLGDPDFWDINSDLITDTIELPDGVYVLHRQHVGPGQFDYKWAPTNDTSEGENF